MLILVGVPSELLEFSAVIFTNLVRTGASRKLEKMVSASSGFCVPGPANVGVERVKVHVAPFQHFGMELEQAGSCEPRPHHSPLPSTTTKGHAPEVQGSDHELQAHVPGKQARAGQVSAHEAVIGRHSRAEPTRRRSMPDPFVKAAGWP